MLNVLTIQGQIPKSEKFNFELKNPDDDKRAFISFMMSVRRDYKPEGAEFYPEDLMQVKAFGTTAKTIAARFNRGDYLLIEGQLRRNDDYQNKNGDTVRGELYIHADRIHFQYAAAKNDKVESGTAKTATSTGAAKSTSNMRLNTQKKSVI